MPEKNTPDFKQLLAEVERFWVQDLSAAEALAQHVLQLAEEQNNPEFLLDAKRKLVVCKIRLCHLSDAEKMANDLIQQADTLGSQEAFFDGVNLLAGIWLNKGRHVEALQLLLEHLQQMPVFRSKGVTGKYLNNIGVAYERMGDLPNALTYYQKSLEHKESIGNFRGIAYTSHNIGMVNFLLENYAEAEIWNTKALSVFEELGDIRGRAPVLNLLGQIKSHRESAERALDIHRQALAFARQTGDGREIAESLMYLANSERQMGNALAAKKLLLEALSLSRTYEDLHQQVELLISGARIELDLEAYSQAFEALDAADDLAVRIAAKAQQRDISGLRAEVFAQAGDYEQAYLNLRTFISLEASLKGAEVEQRIHALSIPLELRAAKAEAQVQRLKAKEMENLSLIDPLTKLGNRRKLEIQLAELKAIEQGFSIALIDVDHFKLVNDKFSHAKGDEVLMRLGQLLQSRIVDGEAFRYGGEEFLLLLVQETELQAETMCEKIRLEIMNDSWTRLDIDLDISVSIGVAHSSEANSQQLLLKLADERLYQAKSNGRNQVVGFGSCN